MGNGERDNAFRDRLNQFIQEDKEILDRLASPPDLCICGTMTRAEHGCLCGEESESRVFATGASRDTEKGKLDYEAFLSPLVLERFAQYMDKHRVQSDGTLRPGDNWQKGIPNASYMKSKWRHFMRTWSLHRSEDIDAGYCHDLEESLCAELFNTMGYLHEVVRTSRSV